MSLKSLSPICAGLAIAMGATSALAESSISSNRIIFCENSHGMLTTMARTAEGKNLPIFHWQSESLPKSSNLKQLCNNVSAKLDNYIAQGSVLSSFGSYEQVGLPTICAEDRSARCSLVLFTLPPTENPINESNKVLENILDNQFKQEKKVSNVRGIQSIHYRASVLGLLMRSLNLIR